MKAEHRKELETNILADRMGRAFQHMKERPKKRTFLYIIGFAIVVLAGIFAFRVWKYNREEESRSWLFIEQAIPKGIMNPGIRSERELQAFLGLAGLKNDKGQLMSEGPPQGNAGKTARFQIAWMMFSNGIQRLGAEPMGALGNLGAAEELYGSLAAECKDDKEWAAEALYALAVIEETKSVRDREHLDKAKKKFDEIVETYPETGYGKLAAQRAKYLEKNIDEVRLFYQNLQEKFKVLKMPNDKFHQP